MWGRGFPTEGLGPGGRGGTPGCPGRQRRGERALGERALGRSAQLPRAPGAGAACPGPVGLGLRAAGKGEENNRRGGREREGRLERAPRGAAPCLDRLCAPGDPGPGPSGSLRSEKSQGPQTWQVVSSAAHPHTPSARPGAPEPGRGTLGAPLLAFSLVLVAPPAAGGRVGGPAAHPLSAPINPCGPVSVLGPALSPGLRASPSIPGMSWGREKVSGLSPVLRAPAPPRSSPRATHQIEASLH